MSFASNYLAVFQSLLFPNPLQDSGQNELIARLMIEIDEQTLIGVSTSGDGGLCQWFPRIVTEKIRRC